MIYPNTIIIPIAGFSIAVPRKYLVDPTDADKALHEDNVKVLEYDMVILEANRSLGAVGVPPWFTIPDDWEIKHDETPISRDIAGFPISQMPKNLQKALDTYEAEV